MSFVTFEMVYETLRKLFSKSIKNIKLCIVSTELLLGLLENRRMPIHANDFNVYNKGWLESRKTD